MDIKEIKKTIQDLREAAEGATLCQECCTSRRRDNVPMWRDLLRRAARIIEDLSHVDMIEAVMRPTKICASTPLPTWNPYGRFDNEYELILAKRRVAASLGAEIMKHVKLETEAHEGRAWLTLQASVWIYVPEDE